MATFNLVIYTPVGKLFNEEVRSVKIPAAVGEVQVLPNHVGYVAVLGTGILEYESTTAGTKRLAISEGFVSFLNDTLTVLSDFAVSSERIDTNYAKERSNLSNFLKSAVYDAPEAARARQQLALINAIDQIVSN